MNPLSLKKTLYSIVWVEAAQSCTRIIRARAEVARGNILFVHEWSVFGKMLHMAAGFSIFENRKRIRCSK